MSIKSIVPGEVTLDDATVMAALETARLTGLQGMSTRTATAVVAMLYFPTSRHSQPVEMVQGVIYDLVCEIVDYIASAHPQDFRRSLRTVLADLDYLVSAFQAGRRPRGTRMIGRDCLMALTGRFPASLLPAAQGLDFSDFGRLQLGGLGLREASLIPLARNTRLLAGAVHLASSSDKLVAVWVRHLSHWPRSLLALGFRPDAIPDRSVLSDRIRRLSHRQKDEIAALARAAGQWLRAAFGIRDDRDPLRFHRANLVLPKASALILTALAEAICPWPARGSAEEILRRIREPHPSLDDACEAMQRSAYEMIFDIIKRRTMQTIGCDVDEFAKRAAAVGLLDPDRGPDAFDRYAVNHVRTFRQIRLINEARVFLQKIFAARRIDMADLDAGLGPLCPVCPRDFHELGRWKDEMNARLEWGLVDRSHGASAKFRRSEETMRMFPSKLPENVRPRRLARSLVTAARKGQSGKKLWR